jgi:hypothetical protein
MTRWRIKFHARKANALGNGEYWTRIIEANTKDEALDKLSEEFDHVCSRHFSELDRGTGEPLHTCPACGAEQFEKYRGLGNWSRDPQIMCFDCGQIGCTECKTSHWNRDKKKVYICHDTEACVDRHERQKSNSNKFSG